ncbi:LytR C-terminal domain-containing protein [Patescibacteria group bacterium]
MEIEKEVEEEKKQEVAEKIDIKLDEEVEKTQEGEEQEEDSDKDQEDEELETTKIEKFYQESKEKKEDKDFEEEEKLKEDDSGLVIEEEEKSKSNFFSLKTFIVFIIGLFIGLLIAGGVFVSQQALNKQKSTVSESKEEDSKTETQSLDEETKDSIEDKKDKDEEITADDESRFDLKIQTLNGSGGKGIAKGAKDLLLSLGYTNIETDNADSYDYEETVIKVKKDKEKYLKALIKDLETEYTIASESGELDDNSEFDVVVIVGKK